MRRIPVFIVLIIILLVSCKKSSPSGDIRPDVKIRYVDSLGNDIFSPDHDGQNGYWMDSVRIYDYKNGINTLIFTAPTLYVPGEVNDTTFGYSFTTYTDISNIPGEYMVVSPNEDVVNRYSNSIIQLKVGAYDTLRVHLTANTIYGSLYDSVWYNGNFEPGDDPLFTVVK